MNIPDSYNEYRLKIYGLPSAEAVLEYLVESQHNNWDGFNERDQEALRRMIKDMNLYASNR
jgi:hypothetical protein